ncbi:MAG: hypothetical protein NVSMB23_05340 [Myxococcales bacterium]
MLGSLQMWRQTYIAGCAAGILLAAGACSSPGRAGGAVARVADPVAASSAPTRAADAPDLVLRGVSFARLVDGRVVAAGAADELRYRRSGGRFEAVQGRARVFPGPGAEALRTLGEVRLTAPAVQGELGARTATASGGVEAIAARGDTARTERATLDGRARTLSGDRPVAASGPGYQTRGDNFLARTDGSRIQLGGGVAGTLVPPSAAVGRRP